MSLLTLETTAARSTTDRLLLWLATPPAAVCGSIAAMLVWVLSGAAIAPLVMQLRGVNSQAPDQLLTWSEDLLGHYLIAASVVCAVVLLFCESHITAVLTPTAPGIGSTVIAWLKVTSVIALLYCACHILNNVYFIHISRKPVHWQEWACPVVFPAVIATAYYMLAVFPLILSQVRLGLLLQAVGESPSDVKWFDTENPDRCFGLLPVGRIIIALATCVGILTVPPLLVQLFSKHAITAMTYVALVVATVIAFHVVAWPLARLSLSLGERRRQVIDECKKGRDSARVATVRQEFEEKLAHAWRLKTIPFNFVGMLIVISSVSTGPLGILKALVELVKATR